MTRVLHSTSENSTVTCACTFGAFCGEVKQRAGLRPSRPQVTFSSFCASECSSREGGSRFGKLSVKNKQHVDFFVGVREMTD